MTQLQRACLLGAILWTGMHSWHAVVHLHTHPVPSLAISAIVLCGIATTFAAAPLVTGHERLSNRAALVLASAGAVVALLVAPFLTGPDVRSYANWPAGGLGVLIAALVLRRRVRYAIALAGASCAVIVLAVIRTGGWDPAWITSLCIPPLLWLGSSILVLWIFDRSATAVDGYMSATSKAELLGRISAAREESATRHRSELTGDVIPVLRRLSVSSAIGADTAAQCARLEAELRDRLRAGNLLTAPVRRLIADLRSSGASISVIDDRRDMQDRGCVAKVTQVLEATLPHLRCGVGAYRLVPDGCALTVVATADPPVLTRVADALEAFSAAVVEHGDGELYARVPV
jgi:hypothetical protein